MPHFHDTYAGPLGGLYLPRIAWEALRQEGIHSIDQLMAHADRLEQFDGIEPKIAQVIRQALACAVLREECLLLEGHPGPWCA
jgi:L-fucose isomerase-like protein